MVCTNGTCQNPPDVIQYNPATYTRDYNAVCESGKKPVWRFFDWQATLPAGNSLLLPVPGAAPTGARHGRFHLDQC